MAEGAKGKAALLEAWVAYVRRTPKSRMYSFFQEVTPEEMAGYFLDFHHGSVSQSWAVAISVEATFRASTLIGGGPKMEARRKFWTKVRELLEQCKN